MTRDEQLVFCRACKNRKMDPQQGLICSLTLQPADFEETCPTFEADQKTLLEIHQAEKPLGLLPIADSGRRFGNYILDLVFFFIAIMGLGMIAGALGFVDLLEEMDYLLGYGGYFVYFCFFEGLYGQSPGKMITGTIVVTEDGKRPDFGTIMLRSLCRFIPFEVFSFFGTPTVGWHDSITKTRVILRKGYQYP